MDWVHFNNINNAKIIVTTTVLRQNIFQSTASTVSFAPAQVNKIFIA